MCVAFNSVISLIEFKEMSMWQGINEIKFTCSQKVKVQSTFSAFWSGWKLGFGKGLVKLRQGKTTSIQQRTCRQANFPN